MGTDVGEVYEGHFVVGVVVVVVPVGADCGVGARSW